MFTPESKASDDIRPAGLPVYHPPSASRGAAQHNGVGRDNALNRFCDEELAYCSFWILRRVYRAQLRHTDNSCLHGQLMDTLPLSRKWGFGLHSRSRHRKSIPEWRLCFYRNGHYRDTSHAVRALSLVACGFLQGSGAVINCQGEASRGRLNQGAAYRSAWQCHSQVILDCIRVYCGFESCCMVRPEEHTDCGAICGSDERSTIADHGHPLPDAPGFDYSIDNIRVGPGEGLDALE